MTSGRGRVRCEAARVDAMAAHFAKPAPTTEKEKARARDSGIHKLIRQIRGGLPPTATKWRNTSRPSSGRRRIA
jgi:hypothetical protein